MPTIAVFRRHRLRATLAWLALAAVLLRGLVPIGTMPVAGRDGSPGVHLAICSGGFLVAGDPVPAGHHGGQVQCPFAFSAMAAIPPVVALLPQAIEAGIAPALRPLQSLFERQPHARPPARAPPLHS